MASRTQPPRRGRERTDEHRHDEEASLEDARLWLARAPDRLVEERSFHPYRDDHS